MKFVFFFLIFVIQFRTINLKKIHEIKNSAVIYPYQNIEKFQNSKLRPVPKTGYSVYLIFELNDRVIININAKIFDLFNNCRALATFDTLIFAA